jgi:hypothetical protein
VVAVVGWVEDAGSARRVASVMTAVTVACPSGLLHTMATSKAASR